MLRKRWRIQHGAGVLLLCALVLAACTIDRQGGGGPNIPRADASMDGQPCSPAPELCDGIDNDCAPGTPDGDDDPRVGEPCDGEDADECTGGRNACRMGGLFCEDNADPSPELCGGDDEDCDGRVDEAPDPNAPAFIDQDGDGYGAEPATPTACTGMMGTSSEPGDCDDRNPSVRPSVNETCNQVDDDCDGQIDEEAGCPCVPHTFSGRTYLFCTPHRNWFEARDECERTPGFELASIRNQSENAWVQGMLQGTQSWIGYTDLLTEGWWRWVDDSPRGYENWEAEEPNGGLFEGCAVMLPNGEWNDLPCLESARYICKESL